MSRRGKRQMAPGLLPWLVALVLVLTFAAWSIPASPVGAQAGTSAATTAAGTPAATTAAGTGGTPAATSGTPTATRTPTLTPTPVPTLTELQARLALAKAYLDGKDYDNAATLYGQIAEDTRGNPTALEGLQAALAGKAAIQATQMAPLPTEAPTPVVVETAPTLASTTASKLQNILATAFAILLVIALLYVFAAFLRWLLTALRELWYMRILPLFGRPIVTPGFVIGEFNSPDGSATDAEARVVPIVMTAKLMDWNRLVQYKQAPVEIGSDRDLGRLGWLRLLWEWILPPRRGYRVTGSLLAGPAGEPQLALYRTNLGRNSVDRNHVFASGPEPVGQDYRGMAAEAAKWLVLPADIEADRAITATGAFAAGAAPTNPASSIFDAAIEILLPVRQQVSQGAVDFPDGRRRLREATAMVAQLPPDSELRAELTRVIADLRKAVPGD